MGGVYKRSWACRMMSAVIQNNLLLCASSIVQELQSWSRIKASKFLLVLDSSALALLESCASPEPIY
jgi:hypothetical protein